MQPRAAALHKDFLLICCIPPCLRVSVSLCLGVEFSLCKNKSMQQAGQRVVDAHTPIRSSVLQTLIEEMPELAPDKSVRLLFKMENLQETGSFKLRGATNKILSLTPQQAADGVIAASNGNHGLGVAAAARRTGIRAEVYVSSHVSSPKAKRNVARAATLGQVRNNQLDAELADRAAAQQSCSVFSSPSNAVGVVDG